MTSVMRCRSDCETGAPSRYTIPAIPHTASVPCCPDGVPALLGVDIGDRQTRFRAPAPDVFLRLPPCIPGPVPVEVYVVVLVEGELIVPEELSEVPVDQTLHVLAAG